MDNELSGAVDVGEFCDSGFAAPEGFCASHLDAINKLILFLILNFRRVLIVVSFLLGKSPASVYYCMPTFRNCLSVPSSKVMVEH